MEKQKETSKLLAIGFKFISLLNISWQWAKMINSNLPWLSFLFTLSGSQLLQLTTFFEEEVNQADEMTSFGCDVKSFL